MKTHTLTAEQKREWDEWLASRPAAVREVAAALPPWHLYRVVETGQHATIASYDHAEDGSVTLSITAWQPWLPVLAHGVFGMAPDDLAVEEEFELLVAG